MRSIVAALLAAFVGSAPPTAGLDPSKALHQYSLSTWSRQDGLPGSTVLAITEDADGFLWLATQDGLARFDGRRFDVFDRRNTAAITHNQFLSLAVDGSGRVWAGGTQDLVVIEGQAVRAYEYPELLPPGPFNALAAAPDGSLWIGTDRGLFHLRDGKPRRYGSADGLVDDQILSLAVAPEGSLWVGARRGLSHWRDGRWRGYGLADGLIDARVVRILVRGDGSVLVGTPAGLNEIRDGKLGRPELPADLVDEQVWALGEDRDGNLWVGLGARGLERVTPQRSAPAPRVARFGGDRGRTSVFAIFEDRRGNLWLGTHGDGLWLLADGVVTTTTVAEGLSHDHVCTVLEDDEGAVWVGTLGGLTRFSGGEATRWTAADGLSDPIVWSLAADPDGGMWIGTRRGLNRLRDGRFEVWTRSSGLADDDVRALHVDLDGRLWVGTLAGLQRFHDGRFETFGRDRGLEALPVLLIARGAGGELWVALQRGGLYRFVDGRFTTVVTPAEVGADEIYAVLDAGPPGNWIAGGGAEIDPRRQAASRLAGGRLDGRLWLGTRRGLVHVRPGRVTERVGLESLGDDFVQCLQEDGLGNVWMGLRHGLARVRREELRAVATGTVDRLRPVIYGAVDGLENPETNVGFQPVCWRRRDGTLLFATLGGLASVDPARLPVPSVPPVFLQQVLVDDQELEPRSELRLPAVMRSLTIHWTSPSPGFPRQRFRHQLEGFDEAWIEDGVASSATYSRLPPGDYRFRVEPSDTDGVFTDPGTSGAGTSGAAMRLVVPPLPWKSPWAYTGYALAVIGGLALYVRQQQMKLRRERDIAERERAVARRLREIDQSKDALLAELEARVAERTAKIEALAEDLRARNTELERFTYSVSHDLKSPLVTVRGFLGFLAKDAAAGDQERLDQDMQHIRGAVDKMQDLIDNLLELSRIGRKIDTAEELDLGVIAREVAALLAGELEALGVELEISADLPTVFGDPTRLRQVLQNLIGNAVKYMGDQSRPRIEVGSYRDESGPVIYVKDNGIGIEPRHQELIFGLFHRLDAKNSGTGVGLALVKRIVEAHGGRIWVESAGAGEGSTFSFTLAGPSRP